MAGCFCVPFLLSLCAIKLCYVWSAVIKKPMKVSLIHGLLSLKQVTRITVEFRYSALHVIKLTVPLHRLQNLDQKKSDRCVNDSYTRTRCKKQWPFLCHSPLGVDPVFVTAGYKACSAYKQTNTDDIMATK